MRVILIALLAAISYAQTGWGIYCTDCRDRCGKYGKHEGRTINCKVRTLQGCKDYCEELPGCIVFNFKPSTRWAPGEGRCCVRAPGCTVEDRGTRRSGDTTTYVLSAQGEGMCPELVPFPSRVPHFDHDICCSVEIANCYDDAESIYGYCFRHDGGRAAVCESFYPPECDQNLLEGIVTMYEDVSTDVAVQSCREGGCLCTQLVADAVAHGLDFDLRCVIGNSMTIEEEAAACEARQCDAAHLAEFGQSYSSLVADSCNVNHAWGFNDLGCDCAVALIDAIEDDGTVTDISSNCLLGTSGMTLKQANDYCEATYAICEENEHDYSNVCEPAVCSHDVTPMGQWHTTVIECKEQSGILCTVPYTPPLPNECCSTCRCDDIVCDPTPCPDGSDPPRLDNECCGRQELCVPACSRSAMRNSVYMYGEDYVQACRDNQCACYTQLLSAIDHGLEFDDSCIVTNTDDKLNLRKTGEQCGYDNGWDRILEDHLGSCNYAVIDSLRGVSLVECRNACQYHDTCKAFTYTTQPDLPSFFDGNTVTYSVNCRTYANCQHKRILQYSGDTYVRRHDNPIPTICNMDEIKAGVAFYGQEYVDACETPTPQSCGCWTMLAEAIEAGLDFDNMCSVGSLDGPIAADLAEECSCPQDDLEEIAALSSMEGAVEACQVRTCECFEALGEVLYNSDYDATCWTSVYTQKTMTLAEQIDQCGYNGCPPENGGPLFECTAEQNGLQCYYGENLCCCGQCRREIYKSCGSSGFWMSSMFSECENPDCDCEDNWDEKSCNWVERNDQCYLHYDDCKATCGCNYDIETARKENKVNDAIVDQTCDPGNGQSGGGWFTDSRGFDCDVYEYAGWCTPTNSGSVEGPNWCPRFSDAGPKFWKDSACQVKDSSDRWGPFEEYRNYNGQDARICCCNSGIQNSNQYKSGSVDNGQCTDYTMLVQPGINGHVWHDVNGFSCAVYEMMNWCNEDGTAGDGWDEQAYGQWSKMGKSSKMRAQQACCVCGGGMTADSLPQPKTISSKIYEKFDNIVQNDLTKPKWASKIRKRCGKFEKDIVNAMKPFSPQEDIQLLSELCSLLDGDITDQTGSSMRQILHRTSYFQ